MAEMVIAMFDAACCRCCRPRPRAGSDTSAVIRREISDGPEFAQQQASQQQHAKQSHDWSSVTVTVDDIYAAAVTGMLRLHGPLEIKEHIAQGHHRQLRRK